MGLKPRLGLVSVQARLSSRVLALCRAAYASFQLSRNRICGSTSGVGLSAASLGRSTKMIFYRACAKFTMRIVYAF
eukprot:2797003-Amphidinium_carterae.2